MQVLAPRYSRRRFLHLLGQGALLAAAPRLLMADQPELVTVSILHTTDLHGHILPTSDYAGRPDLGGLARCATQIRTWLAENQHAAIFDIGDVYQGTEEGLSTRGLMMIRLLNALGYDGWVVGNHDFDWGMDVLRDAVHASAMPVLSANSSLADGESTVRPYLIKSVAGFRVAFVGLTTPGLASWLPPEDRAGFEVLDPVEILQRCGRKSRRQNRTRSSSPGTWA
jgi:2',3'-cyclic-nucleotide 2'-phosphodiesterase/3'-nucleotidase